MGESEYLNFCDNVGPRGGNGVMEADGSGTQARRIGTRGLIRIMCTLGSRGPAAAHSACYEATSGKRIDYADCCHFTRPLLRITQDICKRKGGIGSASARTRCPGRHSMSPQNPLFGEPIFTVPQAHRNQPWRSRHFCLILSDGPIRGMRHALTHCRRTGSPSTPDATPPAAVPLTEMARA